MFEKIDKLRKAPQPVKERLVALIAIVVMGAITVVWFLFSVSSFLKNGIPKSAPSAPTESQTSPARPGIKPPFAL